MKVKWVLYVGALIVMGLAAIMLATRTRHKAARQESNEADSLSTKFVQSSNEFTAKSESLSKVLPPEIKEPSAESSSVPFTATAQITRADKRVLDVKAVDSEFARVLVEPNEVLHIRLLLKNVDPNQDIRIHADHGGSLNHRLGSLILKPQQGNGAIDFQFAIGGNRGKYTLLVLQGNRQELMEFWAGPETPVGQAGPMRIFNPDNT